MSNFLKGMLKSTGNIYGGIASEGLVAGDITGYLDTGSYRLNALVSGSVFKGWPRGKISILGAPSGTGKTFLLLSAIKEFLNAEPDGAVILFESESALTKDMLVQREIDIDRVLILPIVTVEDLKFQAVSIIDRYQATPEDERIPILLGLDSIGMLSTEKEIGDASDGKATLDMTRAKMLKAVFRILTLKLGLCDIPFLATNHTYQELSLYPKTIQSGGTGLVYAGSTIMAFSKAQEKEGKEKVGAIITATLQKGRLTKENSKGKCLINFENGLDRYFDLIEPAVESGIWQKDGKRFITTVNEKPVWAKTIAKDPETYFTKEVLEAIDKVLARQYLYGITKTEDENFDELDGEEIDH